MKTVRFVYFVALLLFTFCAKNLSATIPISEALKQPLIHVLNQELSDVLMKDQFSPPVASRILAYSNIAALYSLNTKDACIKKLNGDLKSTKIEGSDTLASLVFILVAKELIWSQKNWEMKTSALVRQCYGTPSAELVEHATRNSKVILAWAKGDHYGERLTYPRYTVQAQVDSLWQLTPPSYKAPVEPYWGTLRPFYLKNIKQIISSPSFPFSAADADPFRSQAEEVLDISAHLSEQQKDTALFWDCNPLQSNINGHLTQFSYRLTPASHWILITAEILQTEHKNFAQSAEIYAVLAATMADAFIVCWKEKYAVNRIRPITYIQKYMDTNWMSFIQTPDFPEYPSGHSMVSNAAATILSNYFSNDYSFVDNTQTEFGLNKVQFHSFHAAAENAGVSRIYGGIHYRDAIDQGLVQGQHIADVILKIIW